MRWKMPGAPEPAVLVVDRGDAALAASRSPSRVASTHSSSVDRDEARAEPPGRLLAQDPGRLAALVPLDDAAVDLEVAAASASAAELSQSEW